MSDISLNYKRKKSTDQFVFTETEFGFSFPFGAKTVIDQVGNAISNLVGEDDESSAQSTVKSKSKKSDKKQKLEPSALIGLMLTIGVAALTTGGNSKK